MQLARCANVSLLIQFSLFFQLNNIGPKSTSPTQVSETFVKLFIAVAHE